MCFTIREEDMNGAVLLYQRIGENYILKDKLELEGGALCHIVYQPKNQTLYCSFYHTGHIAAVKVHHYHFSELLNFFQMAPDGINELTRAHCCVLEPDGTRVFTANIALDRIYIYESEDGELFPNTDCEFVQLEKGIGPRHLKFHPIQKFLYLITEYSNEVLTFQYELIENKPQLILLQRISTLPEHFDGISYGSSIDITEDGKFLYAANRGADTIAVYLINEDGTLQKIQDVSCMGQHPRHIALTNADDCLMIANQNTDEVVFLGIDIQSGKLMHVINRIPFYKPSYIEEI
jgi:6-phosphogluconolactonase